MVSLEAPRVIIPYDTWMKCKPDRYIYMQPSSESSIQYPSQLNSLPWASMNTIEWARDEIVFQ